MLQIVKQEIISGRLVIKFTSGRDLYLKNTQPSQDELNNELISYENMLLNNIDIKGEEGDLRIKQSSDRYSNTGDNITLGLSPGEILA